MPMKLKFFSESLKDKISSMEITIEKYQYMESIMLKKCGGLPLMIDSLTCALRSMSWSNWEILSDKILTNALLELDEVKEATCAIYELCNNFIRNGDKHKHFLLCCLIHEQGVDVPLEKLKIYALGFGLFEEDSLSAVVNRMNLWVHELKSLSLLLEAKPQHVKIHDIIQNIGISALSQGNDILPVLVDVGSCWHTRESFENYIAISMMSDSNYKCLNGLELNKLQALLLNDIQYLRLPGNFFRGMPGLKVLEITGTEFLELPASIQALNNLVTLHLEYCDFKHESISTISNLDKLEVLSLRGSRFKALPEEFGKLTNLRVLDLTSCKYLRTFPVDAVVKMVRLKELYLHASYSQWNSDDTEKLSKLPLEVLEISITRKISSGLNFNFVNLRKFKILIGEFGDLEYISYFSRVLLIRCYTCHDLVESGLIDLLPRTELLVIDGVSNLSNSIADLYGHVFMNLKSIYIGSCPMECISDASSDVFPELEILTLENLSNLTSICCWEYRHTLFPHLRELRLKNLRKLHPYVFPAQFAVQLRVMEVSKCGSLLYVFPDGADLRLELLYLERLALKDLEALQTLQFSSENSIRRGKRGLLFNGKIKLPSLKEMHLCGLDQIEIMWDLSGSNDCAAELLQNKPHGMSPRFENLKSMTVSQHNNMNSLFTSRIPNSLLQLETLIVEACGRMKEIVTSSSDLEDDNASPTTMIIFPRLKVLRLDSLGCLECFYRGRHWLKFPMLISLHLTGLTKMKALTLQRTPSVETEGTILFDGEIDFPCLEDLVVLGMDNIELLKRPGEVKTFSHLSRLTLRGLPKLKALPSINSKTLRFLDLEKLECCKVLSSVHPKRMPPMSWELEELVLADPLEDLFYDESPVHKLLISLKKLVLYDLYIPRTIWWNILRNLRSLIISNVQGWTSMIPPMFFIDGLVLPLLEQIEVDGCYSLEAIVSQEEDQDIAKHGITLLPSLKYIRLSWLLRLESFSKGSYEAHFPSLETVDICRCPSLWPFSMGPLRTPRLKFLLLNSNIVEVHTFDDVNVILAAFHHEEVTRAAEQAYEWKVQEQKKPNLGKGTDKPGKFPMQFEEFDVLRKEALEI